MDRSLGPLLEPIRDTPTKIAHRRSALLLGLLVGLLILGGLSLTPHPGAGPAPPSALGRTIGTPHALAVSPSATTHGDLNVTGDVTIAPATGNQTYYQGGNVTIQPGGHLTLRNTTLTFVQFIGSSGSLSNRLDHVYRLVDMGQLTLVNSSITTDMHLLNPYPVLSVQVSGAVQATGSSFAFAGSIVVSGSGASFWAYHSRIVPNPDAALLVNGTTDPNTIALYNATRYAPALSVLNGARASLLASVENATYRNPPSVAPLGLRADSANPAVTLTTSSGPASVGFPSPSSDPRILALDGAFPAVGGAHLTVFYNQTGAASVSGSSFLFGGSWPLPQINFSGASGSASVPLPPAAVAAINSAGVPAYLRAVASGTSLVQLGNTNAGSATISTVTLSYAPGQSYNITVDGSGSTLTAADSTMDLTWNVTPGLPSGPAYSPWNSSKIVVLHGAQAFLADDAVPYALPTDYQHQSIAVPDLNNSHVSFFRWLTVPVRGLYGLPVAGATATADYAYSGSQSDNASATALNALATSDPDLANYVSLWDTSQGVPSYGATSPTTGDARLLLASGSLDASGLPDGIYLGDYHVAVDPGSATVGGVQWSYSSLTAYPHRMLPNQSGTDQVPAVVFPNYQASLSVTGPTITVHSQLNSNHTIAVGENVTVNTTVRSSGTGTVAGFSTILLFVEFGKAPVQIGTRETFGSLAPGANVSVPYTWSVNESTVGIHASVPATFTLVVSWSPGNGSLNASTAVSVESSYITLHIGNLPTGALTPGNAYIMTGRIVYSGSGTSYINVSALSSTERDLLAVYPTSTGNFSVQLVLPMTMQPGTYQLIISAGHYGRTVWQNSTAAQFTIAAPPSSGGPAWYTQSFFGIALWLWIVILAAAMVGIVLVLMFVRRLAKGKFVECGECGNLIPENAPSCPKCGAEFETESVRCSRCGATIPAASKVCPECAATLLGRGEERDDPERQGYSDFVERFRTEAKKELGENYAEGSFWDWWRRQSTYVSFNQWRLQQAQGSRLGMTAPRESAEAPKAPPKRPPTRAPPPKPVVTSAAPPRPRPPPSPPEATPSDAPEEAAEAAPESDAGAAPAGGGMKICGTCKKEIPADYLVCPFCGAVTQ